MRVSEMWTQIRDNNPVEIIDDNGKVICSCAQGSYGDIQTGKRGEVIINYPDASDTTKIYYADAEKQNVKHR